MIGLYLDQLNDVERDRVIAGQGWTAGYTYDQAGNRCLIGHVEVWSEGLWGDNEAFSRRTEFEDGLEAAYGYRLIFGVANRFDELVYRVGLDRAVQLVKARAAKPNRVALPEPKPETVEVGA